MGRAEGDEVGLLLVVGDERDDGARAGGGLSFMGEISWFRPAPPQGRAGGGPARPRSQYNPAISINPLPR